MPLLDHFHRPLSEARHWEAFHHAWATCLAGRINEALPGGYLAEPNVHHGARIEIGVAAFEGVGRDEIEPEPRRAVTVAPKAPTAIVAGAFPDTYEVLVHRTLGGRTLVAAVDLVSPSNKDRPETRRVFAGKCAAYLGAGVSLAILDVVTSLASRIHDEVVAAFDRRAPETAKLGETAEPWACAYRPLREGEEERIELWLERLALGEPLPEDLPLWIGAAGPIHVPLESSYAEACRHLKIDMARLATRR